MSDLKFKIQEGGKVKGPSHAEGGIETVDLNKETVAQVEGEERIFSVDDTKELEDRSSEIVRALDRDDQDLANEMAMSLGHRIVEMLARQERINPS